MYKSLTATGDLPLPEYEMWPAEMSQMSAALTSQSKQYATKARDLHRQVLSYLALCATDQKRPMPP